MLHIIVTLNLAVSGVTLYCLFRFIHTATDTLCLWSSFHDNPSWKKCEKVFEQDLEDIRKKRSGS